MQYISGRGIGASATAAGNGWKAGKTKGGGYNWQVDGKPAESHNASRNKKNTMGSKRLHHLIPEIIKRDNMEQSFHEVTKDLEDEARERYERKKDKIIRKLQRQIGNGSFRITRFHEFDVKDGPKWRRIQAPPVAQRIGCNAVMRIVEKYLYPTVIRTSAASIKSRGMHRLYRKVKADIRKDKEGTAYFYMCDIKKFYESIDQDMMYDYICTRIKDPVLLPILENFIRLMANGLSIGLRSSQFFGNILLSRLDHRLKEVERVRYYYRYCDDFRVLAGNKRYLWRIRDIVHEEVEALRLTIKADEAVRPITEGNDFLGFVDDGDQSKIRKRTKQNAARKLHKVKSRKRRQKIIGSFKGMAKWGDCGHLFETLTGKKMEDLGDLNIKISYKDGKKHFKGKSIRPEDLEHRAFVVVNFERDVVPNREKEKYDRAVSEARINGQDPAVVPPPAKKWVISLLYEGRPRKMWTGIQENKMILEQAEKAGKLPFYASIVVDRDSGRYPFYMLTSAKALGLSLPDEKEVERLIKQYNMR